MENNFKIHDLKIALIYGKSNIDEINKEYLKFSPKF